MRMKKIFTSFLLLCATFVAAHAQDAEFRYHGQPLADGAIVTIAGEIDPVWGDIECNTNPASDAINGLVFANKSSKEMKCSAKLTIDSNTMKPSQIQWCMGGQCTLVTGGSLTKDFTTKAGGVTMVQFDCLPKEEGELVATIQVTANLKAYTVKVRFTNNPSSVNTVEATHPVAVAYYSIDGRRVSELPKGFALVRYSDGTVRKVQSTKR